MYVIIRLYIKYYIEGKTRILYFDLVDNINKMFKKQNKKNTQNIIFAFSSFANQIWYFDKFLYCRSSFLILQKIIWAATAGSIKILGSFKLREKHGTCTCTAGPMVPAWFSNVRRSREAYRPLVWPTLTKFTNENPVVLLLCGHLWGWTI